MEPAAEACGILSGLSADLTDTTGSATVMFFIVSSNDLMHLAAIGAQEPFSIMPTVRFW